MLDTIIAGTRRVLDFSVACRAEKLLFASSGAVYGPQPPDITHMPETYGGAPGLADPNADYGEGKRVAELLCAIYQNNHGLKSKIARCFAQIGPHLPLDIHFAVGNFIRDVIGGGPIRVNGDGTPYRSYLYTADLVIWLWTILINGKSCWPYNVGSEEALTIKALAHTVADVLASGMPITVNGVSDPAQKPSRYVPDTKRAQMDLGLRQTVGLREAISKTAAWNMQ
jgi:dTDP-glucose 4,6-dehydratase